MENETAIAGLELTLLVILIEYMRVFRAKMVKAFLLL
jgi:hypothetical protein